jgi:hypothetical protein
MEAPSNQVTTIVEAIHRRFAWAIVGSYAVAALLPGLGVWIRNAGPGANPAQQGGIHFSLPALMLGTLLLGRVLREDAIGSYHWCLASGLKASTCSRARGRDRSSTSRNAGPRNQLKADRRAVTKHLIPALTALSALTLAAAFATQPPADPNAAEAKRIVNEFAARLQGELQKAITAGGPVNAIAVCRHKAPGIASDLSEKTGWDVGRTSLKLRNPKLDAPDAWEEQVLRKFEARKAAGENVQDMTYAEIVTTDGKKRYRFMKAIPTGPLCLTCHGTSVTPEVASALHNLYPNDRATGYKLGDIRGAFTLSKPI